MGWGGGGGGRDLLHQVIVFVSVCLYPNQIGSVSAIIIDRFYIALFSAFEQTHCARM